MNISELMSKDPCTVSPDTPVSEAARLMKEEDVGMVPVIERVGGAETRGRLVGVITDRDIAIRAVADGRDIGSVTVNDVMSKGATTAKASDNVDDVMKVMGREQVRRIPIVDERDQLVGIVSQADVVLKAKSDTRSEHTVEKISEPGGRHS